MMKINRIWEEIEKDTSHSFGFLFRRYSSDILPDIYVGLSYPERLLAIFIEVNIETEVNISSFSNLQEIQIELISSHNHNGKKMLIIKLSNNQNREIFGILCEDLIATVAHFQDEKKLIRSVLNRLESWKSLFGKLAQNGLSAESQRGLFGELYFLRNFLKNNSNYLAILSTWVGVENQVRDFQTNNWAVEVKTTNGNNHQKVYISSERQLDTTHIDILYLYHISLEQLQKAGETLNEIIDSILAILHADMQALNKFRCKLYEVGYFEHQISLYEAIGYKIRQDIFYHVYGDFPRIQENEVKIGVGDVKYSIILSQCTNYIVEPSVIFNNLVLS